MSPSTLFQIRNIKTRHSIVESPNDDGTRVETTNDHNMHPFVIDPHPTTWTTTCVIKAVDSESYIKAGSDGHLGWSKEKYEWKFYPVGDNYKISPGDGSCWYQSDATAPFVFLASGRDGDEFVFSLDKFYTV